MSELQTDSDVWAAIVGTMANDPHPRSRLHRTLRAKMIATDAKGNEVPVRLITRCGPAYDDMTAIRAGDRVRIIGKMAVADTGAEGDPPGLWIDVDSAVRLGAERTKPPSRIGRLIKRLFKTI
ncbi:hypothetical protein [Ralstonia solanacearum]|uniref:hypothetical protein n=1 Tax=Ralstonia solanacearum TaxID=305 RepID=UPI0001D9543F|nr:hypothetical protein [Ralstonia solanacearum]CBJ42540.1 protein of unknown function [Ralstonia solanacearum CFBP2957]